MKTIKPRQNFSQGSLQQTNGSLDIAIMGEGFFVLGNPIGRENEQSGFNLYQRWIIST